MGHCVSHQSLLLRDSGVPFVGKKLGEECWQRLSGLQNQQHELNWPECGSSLIPSVKCWLPTYWVQDPQQGSRG